MAAKKSVKKAAKPAAKSAKLAKPVKSAKKAAANKPAAKRGVPKPAAKAAVKKAATKTAKSGGKPASKAKAAPVKPGPLKQVANALAKALKPAPKAATRPAAKPAAKAVKGAKPGKAVARKPVPAAKPVRGKAVIAKPKQTLPVKPKATTTAAKAASKSVAPAKAPPVKAAPAPAVAPAKTPPAGSRTKLEKSVVSKASSSPIEIQRSRPTGPKGVAAPPGTVKLAPVKGKVMPRYQTDSSGRPVIPPGYRPHADEEYMNPLHLEYFRNRLLQWREDLVEESKQTIENLKEEVRDVGDEAERATRETENSLELRTRDRYRKLIGKIDDATKRVDDGSYGWCVDTGEEIGLDRLEARLTAERTIDAQERWEHRQRQMGD